jgi:beta-glucosidase-like glycosyl hydrolase
VINYIRDNIGFKGVIVTDDINMYALHGEVGKKRSILKKIIQSAQSNQDWKKDYSDSLAELFDFDLTDIGTLEITELCRKKLALTKSDFIESLKNVTKMSLAAGCDIVLHCSGDVEEMKAILQNYT